MKESNRSRMHFGHARKRRTHGRQLLQVKEECKQQRALLREMRVVNNEIMKAANEGFSGS